MRRVSAAAAVFVVGLLAACSGPSTDPVPTTGASPYACDGVPRAGAELLLGGSATVDRNRGVWGDDGVGFSCALSHGGGTLMVTERLSSSYAGSWGDDDASVLASLARQSGATPIIADATGKGYAFGPSAGWVCAGRFLLVEALRVDVGGRDVTKDVSDLVVSMLPWTCGGADAPKATD